MLSAIANILARVAMASAPEPFVFWKTSRRRTHTREINSKKWASLSPDIIGLILEYSGNIINRHGIYMNRFSKTDARYNILQSIPAKKCEKHYHRNDGDGMLIFTYWVSVNIRGYVYLFMYRTTADNRVLPITVNEINNLRYTYCDGFSAYLIKRLCLKKLGGWCVWSRVSP